MHKKVRAVNACKSGPQEKKHHSPKPWNYHSSKAAASRWSCIRCHNARCTAPKFIWLLSIAAQTSMTRTCHYFIVANKRTAVRSHSPLRGGKGHMIRWTACDTRVANIFCADMKPFALEGPENVALYAPEYQQAESELRKQQRQQSTRTEPETSSASKNESCHNQRVVFRRR